MRKKSALRRTLGRRRRALRRLAAGASTALPPGSGGVAITFDDGPDPIYTPQILDVLREHGAVATFFCVGNRAAAQPGLVQRIAAEGHVVASHTVAHPELPLLGQLELQREVAEGRRMVEAALGAPVELFRPPKGYLALRMAPACRRAGVRTWLWTIDPHDWHPAASRDRILAGVGTPKARDVILLHDGCEQPLDPVSLDRSPTVAALPEIIRRIRAEGLEPAALPIL